jgi:AraC family transcriptional regulator, arabinose operon regulatory protein
MNTARSTRAVPFEPKALDWKKYTRSYRDALYLYWSLEDRKKWMDHAAWNDLRVFSCGWYVEAHRHYWERRQLNETILIYCTAGRGFYRQGEKEWTILPGDVLGCPPMTHHSYGADARNPWTIFWMHLSGPGQDISRALLGLTAARPVVRAGIRPRAIAMFRTLFHFMRPPLTEPRMAALNHTARLIMDCLAMDVGEEVSSESIGAGIQRVIDHMERHVDAAADVPAWLGLFRGSRSHFQRQFKRATGQAPSDYFLRLKIRKARTLLAISTLRVSEIAERIGMDDPNYFSRQFRRVTGQSPLAYRDHIASNEAAETTRPPLPE